MAAVDPQAASPGPDGALYDARRRVYYAKPVLRGWLHLAWFGASLAAGPLLVARGHGAWRITALAVYAISVTGLFGISALYHRGTWSSAWSARLQRMDHMMIFFLIAGTATPAFLIALPGAYGLTCLIVMWALTLTAAGIHLVWMNAPETLVGGTFIGLGLLAVLVLPEVWIHVGVVPGTLMLAGGLIYITGALSYHRRRPDPSPSVFGYHEVFHAFVCAAATCQYLSITLITARMAG
ncbi:MAG: PAQR family membrane homeostasis protein TrhA [Streptosporangiaceae bacterium]